MRDGLTLRGFARGQGIHDLQLQTLDGRFRFLLDTEYAQVTREKTSLMPPMKALPEERRNLLAYLSRLGGAVPGPLATELEAISPVAISGFFIRRRASGPATTVLPMGTAIARWIRSTGTAWTDSNCNGAAPCRSPISKRRRS